MCACGERVPARTLGRQYPYIAMPALIIFDFDGTLADSFGFFLSTQRTLAARHGFRAAEAHEVDAARRLTTANYSNTQAYAAGVCRWWPPTSSA